MAKIADGPPADMEVSPTSTTTAPDTAPHTGAWSSRAPGPVKVALVGAGFIADFHLEILSKTPGVELVAVCDAQLERATTAAKRFHVPHAVSDLEELPGLGVELVHLTVPPDLHVLLTRKLLEAGIGVFVEKPLALNAADADELRKLAEERDLPLSVNHNNVFHPAFERMLARLDAGEIGHLQHVRICLSVPLRQLDAGDYTHWMFRTPRNIVFEQATHPISQLERLIGSVIKAKTTLLSTRELHPGQLFHDRWLIAATAERGTAELYLAFGQPFTRSTIEVIGSDGSLEVDLHHDLLCGERKTLFLDFFNSFKAGRGRGRDLARDAWSVLIGWSRFTLGIGERKDAFFVGMRSSIHALYKALHAGTRLPGDGARATAVAAWCDAVAEGIADEAVPVPEFPDAGAARAGEVVLTGATGFIGRRVVSQLLERGVHVTAITRRMHSLPPEIQEPALDGRLRLIKSSLEDEAGLSSALAGAKVCIHLATGGGDSWEAVQHAMVDGSRRVAQLAEQAGIERFIYVSSVAALYAGADAGVAEVSDSYGTDPKAAERPLYARGKIAAEETLKEFANDSEMQLLIVRPGVVLGEGTPMQHSGVGLWVRDNHCVGWGPGQHPLPLVWVDDVADGLVRAALYDGKEHLARTMNLCSRVPLSAQDVVDELRRVTGRDLHFHARSLFISQLMEAGKWIVKRVGGRKVAFPSYRDLKSRSLALPFRCEQARKLLGWEPCEEREAFLDRTIRIYGNQVPKDGDAAE